MVLPPFTSPFERLRQSLSGIEPSKSPIMMTVGEPRHGIPNFIAERIVEHAEHFGRYPAIQGLPEYRQAVADWLQRRYPGAPVLRPDYNITVTSGSRDGLFFALLAARHYKSKKG